MKIAYCFSLLLLVIISCNEQVEQTEKDNRIYLYSISNENVNINWYCHSTIGGFSGSKVDFVNKKTGEIKTIECYYLSDIGLKNDTLNLQLWENDTSGIGISKISFFKSIQIDTTGDQNKNGIDARVSRVIDAKIDYAKPHNFDSRWKHY